MTTYQIYCKVGSTDFSANLGLEIWLDDQPLFNSEHITKETPVSFEFNEDELEHELRFIMKNKTPEHTQINESNEIVHDARLTITDVAFDEIELKQIFIDHAIYTHDFNGTQEQTQTKFYGEMGCNGVVSLKFTTPIYQWMLENM